MIEQALEDMGLTAAEAKVYLTLLQNGQSKTGDIIRLSNMQSSSVYHSLSSLVQKGLASYVFVGKIKEYSAQHPQSFLTFLKEKEKNFEEILPQLKRMEKKPQESRGAWMYEGVRGLKSAFDDVLATMKKGEDYCFFQLYTHQIRQPAINMFFRNYHLKRSSAGINVRGLALRDARDAMKAIYDLPHTKVRFVDEFLPTGLVVYKDKVMTLDWEGKEPIAITIQSRAVAESYRRFFEQKWRVAKKGVL